MNKDELYLIHRDLLAIQMLMINEIERNSPKRTKPVGPLTPVKNK
jgi:hypothetical protein